jgi:hypothetical protein
MPSAEVGLGEARVNFVQVHKVLLTLVPMSVEMKVWLCRGENRKSYSVFTKDYALTSAEFSTALPELRKPGGHSDGDARAG